MSLESKTYYIETWGCQMNEEDSEKLSGMLLGMNYKQTKNRDEANIIIFNTCCVRENAELKVFGNLGELKKIKRERPDTIIALCGCMMQQKGMKEEILKKFPFVDIVFGTHNAYKFPEYLNFVISNGKSIVEVWDKEEEIVEGIPIERESKIKAFVTIMYGCNNFCTYCIVPYVRGRERSRTPDDIEKEIKSLSSQGYKEITLLGQNVNSYGIGLQENINFSGLLRRVNNIDGIERIRFMTSHPKDINEELIRTVAECNKVCEHIHLPLQSGSDRILKQMNRHYTKESYLEKVDKIKSTIKDVSITTDIIVGFPGETEEDFNETLDIVRKVEFDSAFTFLYSIRKGTPAGEYSEQVPEKVKHERFNRLLELVNTISAKKNRECLDKTYDVLIEDVSKNNSENVVGRTRNGKLVNINGGIEDIGNIIPVKIIKAQSFSLLGEKRR